MPTLLQQLTYQYEAEKSAMASAMQSSSVAGVETKLDATTVAGQIQQRQQSREEQTERDFAAQQRENKLQLQQHEREQHLHQLQSINNMLLDMPQSPSAYNSSKYSGGNNSSQAHVDVTSNNNVKSSPLDDHMSISDLVLRFGQPFGSLINAGQKEQSAQSSYDVSSHRNYQQLDNSVGYSNSTNLERESLSNNYYSSHANNMDVPSSPISVHTPASPSTPGSLFSNPYSYSSVNSSPYTSSGSSISNGYNSKQYPQSPVRSPCYGRPIRGASTPYSSPTAEFPPPFFNCNGSRSNSPADSENSVHSVDGSLSDIMNCLTINSGQHRCYPPNPNSLLGAEKYFQNRNSAEIQRLKKYLHNSHQQQQQESQNAMQLYHHHNHGGYGHPRNHHFNQQQHNNNNNNNNNHYASSAYGADKGCCMGNPTGLSINAAPNSANAHMSLDKAARCHRKAASISDANYTWSGTLPQRTQKPLGYSSKVFLGGVPWDITELTLISTFKQFGQIKVEWPGKDQATNQPKGYAYIIFESEKQVKALLASCTHDFSEGGSYYYKISSKRMKGKAVQVIPWAINDSNYVKMSSQKLDAEKTVFVGALHGMMNAQGLATIMNDLFDNVIYAGIDTDKYKYPIGSARVTFGSKHSYNKAISAAFIDVKTAKFCKTLQIDPYIEDAPCSSCYVQQGPYFCRQAACFKYYCHTCWQWIHNNESMSWHEPLSRGLKNSKVISLSPANMGRPSFRM